MRILAADPPGAEKPPILPPAAKTRWQGMISGTGFLAMAWPTSRAASGADFRRERTVSGRLPPLDPPCCGVDLLEERFLAVEIELEARKIRLFAFEITPHGDNRFGDRRRGCTGFGTGSAAPEGSFRRLGAFGRQPETRDARAVPGDPAEAARGFENEIVGHRLLHRTRSAFPSAKKIAPPERAFNPIPAVDRYEPITLPAKPACP
jgi:hypothetical protein